MIVRKIIENHQIKKLAKESRIIQDSEMEGGK